MHRLQALRAISPITWSDNTAQVSQIIDNQGSDSLAFFINVGAIVSGTATFAVLLQEGDQPNLSDAGTVADTDMVSSVRGTAPLTAAAWTFANPNTVQRVGYIGNKRYVRLTVTPSSNAAAVTMSAIAVKGRLRFTPS